MVDTTGAGTSEQGATGAAQGIGGGMPQGGHTWSAQTGNDHDVPLPQVQEARVHLLPAPNTLCRRTYDHLRELHQLR